MSKGTCSPILQLIHRVAEDPRTRQVADAELLRQFAARADQGSFYALVRRHAPMVLDVCRAVLPNDTDAEDAFQATFLVLARKAASIRKTASLGAWLHGVAYRTCLKAKAQFARRRQHEGRARARATAASDDLTWGEVRTVLYDELNGLAERHRVPLVLCYLQGKAQDDAALELGLPKGTLKRRLEEGRALLRARLLRRDIWSAGVLLMSAWPAPSLAAVPTDLLAAAAQAGSAAAAPASAALIPVHVAGLAEGMMQTMLLGKIKSSAALAFVLTAVSLGGWLVWRGEVAQSPALAGSLEKAYSRADKPPKPLPRAPGSGKDNQALSRVVAATAAQLRRTTLRAFPEKDRLGLYLIDLDKGDAALIASEVDQQRAYCGSPSWSKDGRRILFDGSPGQEFDKTRLQMLEVTEQGVGLRSFGFGNCPTLSPDGSRIAFLVNAGAIPGAERGFYVMDANGEGRRRLAAGHGIPRWSPDGKHLLTVSFSNPADLALLDVDTGESRPITLAGYRFRSVPSWADAGTLAAVVDTGKGLEIALVDVTEPATAQVKQVLWKRHDGVSAEPLYPVWCPDRRRCIFVGREKQGQALYVVEPGATPRRLEPERYDGKIAPLALSPDGRFALFCSDRP